MDADSVNKRYPSLISKIVKSALSDGATRKTTSDGKALTMDGNQTFGDENGLNNNRSDNIEKGRKVRSTAGSAFDEAGSTGQTAGVG